MTKEPLKYVLLFTALVVMVSQSGHLLAQRISIDVHAPSEVETGKPFQVVFQINRKVDQFIGPDFRGFEVLSGPGLSMSSRTTMSRGQTVEETSSAYTYSLVANRPGTFQLGEARMRVGNATYSARQVTIKVTGEPIRQEPPPRRQPAARTPATPRARPEPTPQPAPQPAPQPTPQPTPRPERQPTEEVSSPSGEGELFILSTLSNNTPYKGEVVVLTQKLYTRLAIHNISRLRLPSFHGFWTENIEMGTYEVKQERHQGTLYNTIVISRTLLIPQRAGTITIEPSSIKIQRFTERTVNRNIFGTIVQQRVRELLDHEIQSSRLVINVQDLPQQQQPSSFTGGVGQLVFATDVSLSTTPLGEPVELTLQISGTGNLKLLDAPTLQMPGGLELFDPESGGSIQSTSAGMTGTRTWKHLVMPRDTGLFYLPAVEFSYFDPLTAQYHTITTQELELHVGAPVSKSLRTANIGREDVQYYGTDIRHIRTNFRRPWITWITPGSWGHLALIIAPILLLTIWLIRFRKRLKMFADKHLIRAARAEQNARQRIKEAQHAAALGNAEQMHDLLLEALWGFVADKLNLNTSELNRNRLKHELTKKQVPVDTIHRYIETIEHFEFYRYAPVQPTDTTLELQPDQASECIDQLVAFKQF